MEESAREMAIAWLATVPKMKQVKSALVQKLVSLAISITNAMLDSDALRLKVGHSCQHVKH